MKFKITPKRILGVTEIQALDAVRCEPFDMRITLPEEPLAAFADPLQTQQTR